MAKIASSFQMDLPLWERRLALRRCQPTQGSDARRAKRL
jgi:hypothetical protein